MNRLHVGSWNYNYICAIFYSEKNIFRYCVLGTENWTFDAKYVNWDFALWITRCIIWCVYEQRILIKVQRSHIFHHCKQFSFHTLNFFFYNNPYHTQQHSSIHFNQLINIFCKILYNIRPAFGLRIMRF